ncbi:Rrf2 family transcriptional regulator [uncultured Eubacterium sp.]|uniref:RrF2 family transcriptional regulator n=1 Tax=uncultured Eubacterium sp. TaxID=165185 RepID=UPI0026735A2B|nr:RrF2 family transcriptional regulator [uncultured Eubacterium sp.]
MMISTKGRYALRVMIDLAQNSGESFVSLKDVAGRQEISMKYLEMIVSILNRGKMVKSQRGKAGGYRLMREPSEYTVGSIIKLAEGSLAPVSCVEEGGSCDRMGECVTFPLWKKLDDVIDEYLENITLQDLLEGKID